MDITELSGSDVEDDDSDSSEDCVGQVSEQMLSIVEFNRLVALHGHLIEILAPYNLKIKRGLHKLIQLRKQYLELSKADAELEMVAGELSEDEYIQRKTVIYQNKVVVVNKKDTVLRNIRAKLEEVARLLSADENQEVLDLANQLAYQSAMQMRGLFAMDTDIPNWTIYQVVETFLIGKISDLDKLEDDIFPNIFWSNNLFVAVCDMQENFNGLQSFYIYSSNFGELAFLDLWHMRNVLCSNQEILVDYNNYLGASADTTKKLFRSGFQLMFKVDQELTARLNRNNVFLRDTVQPEQRVSEAEDENVAALDLAELERRNDELRCWLEWVDGLRERYDEIDLRRAGEFAACIAGQKENLANAASQLQTAIDIYTPLINVKRDAAIRMERIISEARKLAEIWESRNGRPQLTGIRGEAVRLPKSTPLVVPC